MFDAFSLLCVGLVYLGCFAVSLGFSFDLFTCFRLGVFVWALVVVLCWRVICVFCLVDLGSGVDLTLVSDLRCLILVSICGVWVGWI